MSIDSDKWIDRGINLVMLLLTVFMASRTPPPAGTNSAAMGLGDYVGLAKQFWPLVAMVVLVGWNFAIQYRRPPRPKGPFLRGQLIISSGSGQNVVVNTLRGAALKDFRRDYKVAIICGLEDKAVDKYQDTRISKSAMFTITSGEMEIV